MKALYKESGSVSGWVSGQVKQLALYPVRRVAKLAKASTGVPKDFARTYLLARAVDLCLSHNLLLDTSSSKARSEEAAKIRAAFDAAFSKLDGMLLKTVGKIVRREFTEMGPEVKAGFLKILVTNGVAKNSSVTKKGDANRHPDRLEQDASFAKLVANFDSNFLEELGEEGVLP